MSDEQIYDSDPNEDTSWLVTYGDMVTLLMAFFVLMYSASKVSEEKYEQVAQSIAQGFNSPGPDAIVEVYTPDLTLLYPTLPCPTPLKTISTLRVRSRALRHPWLHA